MDSVFDRFLTATPFESDQPLMPVAEINRVLDAIEQASAEQQSRILTEQTEALLKQAEPFLATGDVARVAALTWNAGVALQSPIFSAWSLGWQAGAAHMIQEMIAAVPPDLLGAVSQQFAVHNSGLRFASPQDLGAIAALLKREPTTLVNTSAETAVLRRVNRLAGDFGNDQLGTLRADLIAAMSPDIDGKTLSRKDLLQRIESNLSVGKARASAIARTELTYAYNTSRIATAVESPLVSHFRFLAISDTRTTDICRTRNGIVFKAEDAGNYRPPLHVNCRSVLSPVMGTINPTHQDWIDDPERQPENRELAPLPKGWQMDDAPKPKPKPNLNQADQAIAWKRGDMTGGVLNGIKLEAMEPPDFSAIADVDLPDLPAVKLPPGKALSTGAIVIEDDGRIWLVSPTNEFGGYKNTFPKGRLDAGLTHQQNALKEIFEEAGLMVDINGYLGDFEGDTTVTRYFIAKRTGGHPGMAHWETDTVRLVPLQDARALLNMPRDQQILDALESRLNPPAAPTKTKKPPAFPRSLDKLESVKPLGGSTGATLVRDPATGKQFVMKRGNNADHLREEFAADEAYRALGVPVPKAKLYETKNGPVKLAEFIEGDSLATVLKRGGQAVTNAIAQIEKHFAVDALLGNWDVAGLDLDNILIGKNGVAYRIDNGGSLRFRAMGAPKGDRWNPYPTELFSLRDETVNTQTASIFAALSHKDLVTQMEAIAKQEKKLLKALPVELHDTIKGRLAEMRHLSQVSRTLLGDQWTDEYTNRFARHTLGIRAAGIVDRLPQQLNQVAGGGVYVADEAGKRFDSLRGQDSIIEDLNRYMSRNGADHQIISEYMQNQGGDSWNKQPAAFKYWLANQRNTPTDRYFWRYGLDYSRQAYDDAVTQWGREKYADSLASWHAFNHEMLAKVDFAKKNRNGTVTLIRTESQAVMDMYGLKPGDKGKTMLRGFAESFSIYEKVEVFGSELTEQQVPLHRIFGTYWTEKHPGQGGSGFLGDSENEFVAMTDGTPFDYLGKPPKPGKSKKQPTASPPLPPLVDDDDFDLDELLGLL